MIFRKVTTIFQPDRVVEVEANVRSLGVLGVYITKVRKFGAYDNFLA